MGVTRNILAKQVTPSVIESPFTSNKQQIRDVSTRMLYVSGQIDHCARNKLIKFKIWPLYKMQSENAAVRKMKEHSGVFNLQRICKLIHDFRTLLCSLYSVTLLPVFYNVVAVDAGAILYVF